MNKERVIKILVEIEQLFDQHRVTEWLNPVRYWISELKKASTDQEIEKVRKILRDNHRGLLDLAIDARNGHLVEDDDRKRVNEKYSELRQALYHQTK